MDLSKIKNVFVDEEKKLKPIPLIAAFMGFVLIVFFITSLFGSSSKEKNEDGYINIDLNIPEKKEDPKVQLESSDGEIYITKDEMKHLLSQLQSGQNQIQESNPIDDFQTIELDRVQSQTIEILRSENETQMMEFQKYLLSQQENFQKDLLTKFDRLHAEVLNQNGSSNSNNPSSYNSIGSRSNIPSNDYVSTSNNEYTANVDVRSKVIIDNYYTSNNPLVLDQSEKEENTVSLGYGINAGTIIKAKLLTGAVSSAQKCPVLIRTLEDVIYKDEILIPSGTEIMGYGETDFNVRKIFINLDKIILGNREIKINAHLMDKDGNPGFCSKYIDKSMEKFLPTFLMNFVAGLSNAFKDVTYVVSDDGIPVRIEDINLKNVSIDGVQSGVYEWSNKILSDAQRIGAIIIVDANLDAQIFIDQKIPYEDFKRRF